MKPPPPATVAGYIASLPPDRRAAVEAVRAVILKNLDADYEEGIQYKMIGYYVPHRVYPAGYHCDPKQPLPFIALGSNKSYISLHLMCLYAGSLGTPGKPVEFFNWFTEAFKKAGKKLDMGKACIRFKSADDLALDVIGQAVKKFPAKKWIAQCESLVASRTKPRKK